MQTNSGVPLDIKPVLPFRLLSRTPECAMALVLVAMAALGSSRNAQAGQERIEPCAAANTSGVSRIEQILKAAVCTSPELSGALADERKARYLADEAATALRPVVSVQVATQGSLDRPATVTADRTTKLSSPALAVSQTLYDSGATAAKQRQRQLEVQAQHSSSIATLRDVLTDTTGKLVGLIGAKSNTLALRENESLAQRSLSLVQARFKAGNATRVDVLSAESQMAEATRQRLVSEGDEQRYTGQLAQRLGAGVDLGPLSIDEDPVDPAVMANLDEKTPQSMIYMAVSANPTLADRLSRADAAAAQIDAARADDRWSLKWSGQTGPQRQWSNAANSKSWHTEVALVASLPLSDGGARQSRIRQAVAGRESATADAQKQRLEVAQDAWSKWSQWNQAQQTRRAAQVALDAADALATARASQYQAGAGSLSDLLTAQTQLATQRRELSSARADVVGATLYLLLITGTFDHYADLRPNLPEGAAP